MLKKFNPNIKNMPARSLSRETAAGTVHPYPSNQEVSANRL